MMFMNVGYCPNKIMMDANPSIREGLRGKETKCSSTPIIMTIVNAFKMKVDLSFYPMTYLSKRQHYFIKLISMQKSLINQSY